MRASARNGRDRADVLHRSGDPTERRLHPSCPAPRGEEPKPSARATSFINYLLTIANKLCRSARPSRYFSPLSTRELSRERIQMETIKPIKMAANGLAKTIRAAPRGESALKKGSACFHKQSGEHLLRFSFSGWANSQLDGRMRVRRT